jgi:hypothetical protein
MIVVCLPSTVHLRALSANPRLSGGPIGKQVTHHHLCTVNCPDFQDIAANFIKGHGDRVSRWQLGSSSDVRVDMMDSMSRIWAQVVCKLPVNLAVSSL